MKILKALALTLLLTTTAHGRTVTITPENAVIINEAITGASVTTAIQSLASLDAERTDKREKIYIVLNSPGGDIDEADKLINFANTVKNIETICINCYSAAFYIIQKIKAKRLAILNNKMMMHQIYINYNEDLTIEVLEKILKQLKLYNEVIAKSLSSRIGITLERYKKLVKDEWWIYAQESVELNIVDETIQLKCSQELINKKIQKTVMTIFGPTKGPEVSACPLM